MEMELVVTPVDEDEVGMEWRAKGGRHSFVVLASGTLELALYTF